MNCRKEAGGALGRRLITLLFAGWVPHDSVFVTEEPLSLIGHRPEPAQAILEDFPDRGCALLLACKYVFAFAFLFSTRKMPLCVFKPAERPDKPGQLPGDAYYHLGFGLTLLQEPLIAPA